MKKASPAMGFFSRKPKEAMARGKTVEMEGCPFSPDSDEGGNCSMASALAGDATPTTNPTELLHKLIDLQSFGGSWVLTSELCALLGINLNDAEAKVDKRLWAVFATVLAVVFCRMRFQAEEDVWDLVVGKAEEWLEERVREGGVDFEGGVEGLKNEARGVLGY
jgi:hypothetical protein